MKSMQGKIAWTLLFVAAIVFPLAVPNSYYLTVMTLAFIMALATLGLNLLTGYTGQLNLAHGGFMAIGAYTLALEAAPGCAAVLRNRAAAHEKMSKWSDVEADAAASLKADAAAGEPVSAICC